jgi:hypothetical protein
MFDSDEQNERDHLFDGIAQPCFDCGQLTFDPAVCDDCAQA